jgi:DNA invertase Pin-like site-specific DNA recombinase
VTENVDTITPAGRMMMHMVSSFAGFERAMIRERTSFAIAVARAEGRIGDRIAAGFAYWITEFVIPLRATCGREL